jgi:NADH-ubiquinone oxidoreductase chain 2
LNTDIKLISELKGQFFQNPLLSLSLSICLFSMAGIPPLIGFFSKQFVLSSAIESGYNFMSIIAILVSVISASYYLKIIKVLNTETTENTLNDTYQLNSSKEELNVLSSDSYKSLTSQSKTVSNNSNLDNKVESNQEDSVLTNFHSFLISSLTLTILLFVLKPSIILNSTQLLSLSLFNY